MMTTPIKLRRQTGVTLLEVLIALIVFSIGLIGVAGILVISLKSNQVAFQRTQSTFIAQSFADRLRFNTIGVWNGGYANLSCATPPAIPPACTSAAPCTTAQLAVRDFGEFCAALTDHLPAGTGTIVCARPVGAPTPPASMVLGRAPYDGTCTISVSWTEQARDGEGGADVDTGTRTQTLTLMVQP